MVMKLSHRRPRAPYWVSLMAVATILCAGEIPHERNHRATSAAGSHRWGLLAELNVSAL
jgi:hypothetical protein